MIEGSAEEPGRSRYWAVLNRKFLNRVPAPVQGPQLKNEEAQLEKCGLRQLLVKRTGHTARLLQDLRRGCREERKRAWGRMTTVETFPKQLDKKELEM